MNLHLLLILLSAPLGSAIDCSMCSTILPAEGINGRIDQTDRCVTLPPAAQRCGKDLNYCITVKRFNRHGALEQLTRGCSPFTMPSTCQQGRDQTTDEPLTLCYTTCDHDGCNLPSSSAAVSFTSIRARARSRATGPVRQRVIAASYRTREERPRTRDPAADRSHGSGTRRSDDVRNEIRSGRSSYGQDFDDSRAVRGVFQN